MNTNNFTINVVEPSPAVPDTGLSTQNIATGGGTTLLITITVLALIAIVTVVLRFKHNHVIVSHNFKRHFKTLFTKRSFVTSLSILAIIISALTFTLLKNNSSLFSVNAEEGEETEQQEERLSVTAENVYLEAELGDSPVYVEGQSKIIVESPTTNGYTLSAYAESSDLHLNNNISDEDHKITAVSAYSTNLTDNTWGFSLTDPTDQNSTTFRGLPSDQDNPMILNVKGANTEANDETTIYYGAYLTPDLVKDDNNNIDEQAYGEYSTTINYIAVAHPDTSDEDITVNYHGNGLKFPNGEDTNTVVYGDTCKMTYVGGNCTTAYRATEPYKTVTQDSIREEGTYESGLYYQYITVPGADKIQITTDYSFENAIILFVQGEYDLDHELADGIDAFEYLGKGSSSRTLTFYGDTITVMSSVPDDEIFTANIYPVYNETPEGIEAELTSICNIMRSDNVDDDGVQDGAYNTPSEIAQVITIPNAKEIKVELEYAFNTGGSIYVANSLRNPSDEKYFNAEDSGISGRTTITLEGNTVVFEFYQSSGIPIENYDYGFYAKVYPVYDDETEDTIPTESCYFGEKKGEYIEPINYKGEWYNPLDGNYYTEDEIIPALEDYREDLKGTTIDVQASNPYAIVYDGNNASAGTMDGFVTTLTADNATELGNYDYSLIAPNFKKEGYGFAGWSLDKNATVNNTNPNAPRIFGPNEQVTEQDITASDFTEDNGRTARLYAVWVPTSGTLQNWTGCSTMTENQVIALTDTRDNNVYTIAKLKDGNCWMTENLRLDNTATITPQNTDDPALPLVNNNGLTSNHLSSSSDGWCFNDSEDCINRSYLNTNNTNIDGTNATGQKLTTSPGFFDNSADPSRSSCIDDDGAGVNCQWYSYGNYYNWYSATAGTGTYDIDASTEEKTEATGSICPAGWTLPIGYNTTESGSFSQLDRAMGGTGGTQHTAEATNRWRSFPVNLVYSGISVLYRGAAGGYWSRTATNADSVYVALTVGNHELDFSSNGYKYAGFSVRCYAIE